MKFLNSLLGIAIALVFASCMGASEHSAALHSSAEREMTVGIVQKTISKGMAQDEVAAALGSPNIVTKDREGDETWIYDKIATEASYSSDSGSVAGLGGGGTAPGSSLFLGILAGNYSKSAGASATTQKTLTVIIKFAINGRVKDFSYHASKF